MLGWIFSAVLLLGGHCFVERCRDQQPKGAGASPGGKAESAWQTVHDPTSGATYYYNASTNETRWDPP